MKHTSNTESNSTPFNLTVLNILNVPTINTSTLSSSTITNNTITSVTTNTTTLNATTINASTINATNFSTTTLQAGNTPFTYDQGTFTPKVQCLRATDGVLLKEDWANPIYQVGNGYYIKIGAWVNVWFSARVDFNVHDNDPLSQGNRFPVITDLPFRCNSPTTNPDLQGGGVITEVEFPNGYAGPVPGPASITMNGNYTVRIYETGSTFFPVVQPVPVETEAWISDGITLVVNCDQTQWGLGPVWELEGTAYNANVTLGNYTASFTGSITYFTDE